MNSYVCHISVQYFYTHLLIYWTCGLWRRFIQQKAFPMPVVKHHFNYFWFSWLGDFCKQRVDYNTGSARSFHVGCSLMDKRWYTYIKNGCIMQDNETVFTISGHFGGRHYAFSLILVKCLVIYLKESGVLMFACNGPNKVCSNSSECGIFLRGQLPYD